MSASLVAIALLGLAPVIALRLDEGMRAALQQRGDSAAAESSVRLDASMRAGLQQDGEFATATESSFVPARALETPATLPSFVLATPTPTAHSSAEATRGYWQDSRRQAYIWDVDPAEEDSLSARDISRKVAAAVESNKVSFFQGRVGDSTMRFGVANNKRLPRPILVAEKLEGEGAAASWVSVPVTQFRRREDLVGAWQWDSAMQWNTDWSVNEIAAAKELLGTWEAPSTPLARAVTALQRRPPPSSYEFGLSDQGRWVVTAEGAEPWELKPTGFATFKGNVDDAVRHVSSSLLSPW